MATPPNCPPANPGRRRTLATALIGALCLGAAGPALAQAPAAEPIRLVVAWPAGGPTDAVARIIALKLGDVLSRRVIVDNKPGAAGGIGSESVVRAAPDGNTLLMAVFQDVTRAAMGVKQPFDTLKDLEPIHKVYDLPFLLVANPAVLPANTLSDVIQQAKTQKLSYATSSVGSMGHLSFELIAQRSGIQPVHVAYRGSAPAVTDLLGGHVPLLYGDIVSMLPHLRSGRLKAIAIGTPERISALPSVPTVSESGFPGFVGVAWGGIMGPAHMPAAVRDRLVQAMRQVMGSPDVQARIREAGVEPARPGSADDFGAFMKDETSKWTQIIKDRGITAQ